MQTLRRRQTGLSLVEILVALTIFVVGLLAVMRIFPRSLGLVERVADRNEAVRLAESRLNELRSEEARLPRMILSAGAPTDLRTCSSSYGFLRLAAATAELRPYDLDRPFLDAEDPGLLHRRLADDRLVVGERAIVPRGLGRGATGEAAAHVYHTLFGPIGSRDEDVDCDGSPDGPAPALAVFRDFRRVDPIELRRTVVTDSGGANLYQDRPVFAVLDGGIDTFSGAPAADRLLLELSSQPRQLVVKLAYRDDVGRVQWTRLAPGASGVVGRTPPTPPAQLGFSYEQVALVHPLTAAPLVSVIPESVEIRQIIPRDAGSLASPWARFAYRDVDAEAGILYFSPWLAGEELRLEYLVESWRNLRETVEIEVAAAGLVTTPDGLVQVAGRFLDVSYLPQVVVEATGQRLDLDALRWPDENLAMAGLLPLDPTTTVAGVAAGRVRLLVYYRRQGNWAVAPAVAPESYLIDFDAAQMSVGGDPANYPHQSVVVEVVPDPLAAGYTLLRFKPSEAGATVAVNYELASGEQVVGEIHVVPPQANHFTGGAPSLERHQIRLRQPNVAQHPTTFRPSIWSIEGRSLRLRVTYDDQQLYQEAEPVSATPTGNDGTSEQLLELSWYVRRNG